MADDALGGALCDSVQAGTMPTRNASVPATPSRPAGGLRRPTGRNLLRPLLVMLVATLIGGCQATTTTTPSPLPAGGTTADLAFCVSEANGYRAMVGAPALTESRSVETFAAAAAQSDAADGTPHAYYRSHLPVGNSAENEAAVALFGTTTIQDDIRTAIGEFWSEGPSGGHYQNLVGPFTQLGCGLFVSTGMVLIVQDFR